MTEQQSVQRARDRYSNAVGWYLFPGHHTEEEPHAYVAEITGLGKRGSPGGEQAPPDASVPYYPCGMKQPEEFSEYYADLLEGRYDCVDRIVLTGYFPLGQQGGGFRYWWRKLTGSDESLEQAHLLHMAGRFSRTFDTLGLAA